MTFYQLLLFASLVAYIFALEAEISQKVKVKNKIYTCLFKIHYKEDTCQANSKVSCSPKVREKKKTIKDVTFALDDGTLIYIEKLRLKGKKAKILGCKALNPDTAKPGDTSDSDYTNQTRIGSSSCSYTDKYTNCPTWKDPYCTSGRWVSWMMTNCAKTCKCCTPSLDKYWFCSSYVWACTDSRYPWFKEGCATTCKYCVDGKCDPSSNPTLNQNMETSTPFSGTVHDLPNISPMSESETKFKSISFIGLEQRTMWDYRAWIQVEAFIFKSIFSDNMGVPLEIRVNPEFGTEAKATEQALRYSQILGQIPLEFRARLEILDLNKGTWSDGGKGGGNYHRKSMNLNTGAGEDMIEKKTIQNFFIHEGSHVSFDYLHRDKGEWICAQNDDGKFISSYARDNPAREDIAESVTAWYVITFHPDSVSKEKTTKIRETIPHRIQYFDKYIQILS